MEAIINEEKTSQKAYKGKFWIIKEIYLYIIGIGFLLRLGGYLVFSVIVNIKELSYTTALSFAVIFYLIAVIAGILAIKWGVESVLKKSIIYPQEIWKISLLIAIISLFSLFLLSEIGVREDFLVFSPHEDFFMDFYEKHIITLGLISIFIDGTATYLWFKILTNNPKYSFSDKRNKS